MTKQTIGLLTLLFFSNLTPLKAAELPFAISPEAIADAASKTPVKVETLAPGFYVLKGQGGNIAVSIGRNGTLIVDDQYPEMVPKIQAAIRQLGGEGIDFAINTHWHFDHADGNQVLGPEGTWLVAQAHSRAMMQGDHRVNMVNAYYDQKAYADEALPVITFNHAMQFHFNDQTIDLIHVGSAHTTGDAAVYFREHNAVHMGDVYNQATYPFIDVDNGGSLEGVINFCQQVLARLDKDSLVIPGHGEVVDYQTFQAYLAMLNTLKGRLLALIDDGATLEQVMAARISREWDQEKGDPAMFINRAYTSLRARD